MRAYGLPLKYGLIEHMQAYGQECRPMFRDVRECSDDFIKIYEDVWKVRKVLSCTLHDQHYITITASQAIERGSMKKLKDSISLMKETYLLSGNYLDVCFLQTTVSQISEKVVVYYVTLLAHAAIHQRLEMVNLLIKEGASKS